MQGVQLTDDLGHPDNDGSPAGAEGHAGGSFITLFTFVTATVVVRYSVRPLQVLYVSLIVVFQH